MFFLLKSTKGLHEYRTRPDKQNDPGHDRGHRYNSFRNMSFKIKRHLLIIN